jgi:hypothetical protein
MSPSCPSCGYDLSGVVESWKESCPLEGVCSECGFELRWRGILFSGARVRGFYEHAKGIAFISAWRTWLWTLLPWVFWGKMAQAQRVHLRRAVLWLAVLLLSLQLLHAVRVVAPALGIDRGVLDIPASDDLPWIVSDAISPLRIPGQSTNEPGRWPIFVVPCLTLSVALPLMLFVLRRSLAMAGVNAKQVLRSSVFGLSWLVWLGILRLEDDLSRWHYDLFFEPPPTPATLYIEYFQGPTLADYVVWEHRWTTLCVIFVWIEVWWLIAIRTGLRMKRWFPAWLAITLPSLIIAILVTLQSDTFAWLLRSHFDPTRW